MNLGGIGGVGGAKPFVALRANFSDLLRTSMAEPIQPSRKRLRTLCAEVDPDDGSDPRYFFRKDGDRKPGRHKARQLAKQVGEILDGLLAGSTADPVLGGVTVVGVEPAPDAATLLVTVTRTAGADPVPPGEILEHLGRAAGWLRSEVAAAITRKRAPMLVYRVVEVRPGSP